MKITILSLFCRPFKHLSIPTTKIHYICGSRGMKLFNGQINTRGTTMNAVGLKKLSLPMPRND